MYYSVTTLTEGTWQNFLQIKRLNIVDVNNKFPTDDYNSVALYCTAWLIICWKLLLTSSIFYSLNLRRIVSGVLGWGSHTVRSSFIVYTKGQRDSLVNLQSKLQVYFSSICLSFIFLNEQKSNKFYWTLRLPV